MDRLKRRLKDQLMVKGPELNKTLMQKKRADDGNITARLGW